MLPKKSTSDPYGVPTAKRPHLEVTTHDSLCIHGEREITPILIKHRHIRSSNGYFLGGFLETKNSPDFYGKFLHSFCNLEESGILYKQLKIRDGQFLLSINGKDLFGYASVSHDEVMNMFSNLPVNKENIIIVWDPNDAKTPIQETQFKHMKNKDQSIHELKTMTQEPEFVVTSITRTASTWKNGRTVAIKLKDKDFFLQIGKEGKLQIATSDDFIVDNKCHFEEKTKLISSDVRPGHFEEKTKLISSDVHPGHFEEKTKLISSDVRPVKLILYKHVEKDIFLGYKENIVGLFGGSEDDDCFHFQYCTNCELLPYCRKGTCLWYDSQSSSLKVVSEDEHTLGKKFIIENLTTERMAFRLKLYK